MRFEPTRGLSGELTVPADKSISHRAALIGAMASEPVRIERYLHAADTTSTLRAIHTLGALVQVQDQEILIRGTGLRDARQPDGPIDVGNAGTLMRLLPGWLVAQEGQSYVLDGDDSIRRRPVDRVIEPLRLMGAELSARNGRLPPLHVSGARLRAISCELAVASAQVKSCVLLAALAADGATTVGEPARSRDHTERILLGAGVAIHRNGRHVTVVNTDELLLDSIAVPGDVSSASFLIAAGVLVPGSRLLLRDVGVNWTRTGFLRILRRMKGIVLGDLEDERGELEPQEPVSRPRHRARRAGRHDRGARRGPAGDRRAAARGPARLLRRGRDHRPRRPGAATQGVRSHRRGRQRPARPRGGHRGDRRRLRRPWQRRPARWNRSTPTATTAWRCSAPSRASRHARGSRCWGSSPRRSPTRTSSTIWPDCARSDRRPGRRGQVDRRTGRRQSPGLHLSGQRRDVSLRGPSHPRTACRHAGGARARRHDRAGRATGRPGRHAGGPAPRAARRP